MKIRAAYGKESLLEFECDYVEIITPGEQGVWLKIKPNHVGGVYVDGMDMSDMSIRPDRRDSIQINRISAERPK